MNYQAREIVERCTALISQWEGVECVTLNEAALPDVLDPYFALILDVFYEGALPPPPERAALYGGGIALFESSGSKDRFLSSDIPVRIEYKPTGGIDELTGIAASAAGELFLIKDSGTYAFYRLLMGKILFSRSDWILKLRERLANLSDVFWDTMREACQSKMSHFLSDLGAAYLQNDDFFLLMSAAGFIKAACLTLFCVNRRFEPSHRQYYEQVLALPKLPDGFSAQLETFLRTDANSAEHRYPLARLIACGIVAL